ncbi:hypothetical protein Tco_1274223 [Tanacetum coccineum]
MNSFLPPEWDMAVFSKLDFALFPLTSLGFELRSPETILIHTKSCIVIISMIASLISTLRLARNLPIDIYNLGATPDLLMSGVQSCDD